VWTAGPTSSPAPTSSSRAAFPERSPRYSPGRPRLVPPRRDERLRAERCSPGLRASSRYGRASDFCDRSWPHSRCRSRGRRPQPTTDPWAPINTIIRRPATPPSWPRKPHPRVLPGEPQGARVARRWWIAPPVGRSRFGATWSAGRYFLCHRQVVPRSPQMVSLALARCSKRRSYGQFVDFVSRCFPRRIAGSSPAAAARGADSADRGRHVWIGGNGGGGGGSGGVGGRRLLDAALLAAVNSWCFTPATLGGVPVSVRLTVRHEFQR
jgi:hypothetical protein